MAARASTTLSRGSLERSRLGGQLATRSNLYQGDDRGFAYDAVETLVDTYLKVRMGPEESFLATYRRTGQAPFKEALYGTAGPSAPSAITTPSS